MINYKENWIWKGFYRIFSNFIVIMKKNIWGQVAFLFGLFVFIFTVLKGDINTPFPLLTAFFNVMRIPWLIISFILLIPCIVVLILEAFSKEKEYDEKPYYMVLKSIIHLLGIVIYISALSILFPWIYLMLSKLNCYWIIFVVSATIIVILITIISEILKHKFGIIWYNPLIWFKDKKD